MAMGDNQQSTRVGARRRNLCLDGQWHAIWQTTVDGAPNLNTEVVRVTQRGGRLRLENLAVSPENPIGGYLWRGEAALRDNHFLIGSYAACAPHVGSQGSLYFVVNRSGDYMTGKWVGCNLDAHFTWGFAVLARDRERARDKLFALLGTVRAAACRSEEGPAGADSHNPRMIPEMSGGVTMGAEE